MIDNTFIIILSINKMKISKLFQTSYSRFKNIIQIVQSNETHSRLFNLEDNSKSENTLWIEQFIMCFFVKRFMN